MDKIRKEVIENLKRSNSSSVSVVFTNFFVIGDQVKWSTIKPPSEAILKR